MSGGGGGEGRREKEAGRKKRRRDKGQEIPHDLLGSLDTCVDMESRT